MGEGANNLLLQIDLFTGNIDLFDVDFSSRVVEEYKVRIGTSIKGPLSVVNPE